MPTIAFYCQRRFDGGVRSGIGVDDSTRLHHFAPGSGASDPALLWFVDVRCSGDRLPRDAELARQWLVRQGPAIESALRATADRLELGSDGDQPIRQRIELARGFQGEVVASSVRRLAPGELAVELRELADSWQDQLARLEPMAVG